jgi:hypothetical protein
LRAALPRAPFAFLAAFQRFRQRSFHLLSMLTIPFIAMNTILVVSDATYGDSMNAFIEGLIVV